MISIGVKEVRGTIALRDSAIGRVPLVVTISQTKSPLCVVKVTRKDFLGQKVLREVGCMVTQGLSLLVVDLVRMCGATLM